jgi:hypothetical protein
MKKDRLIVGVDPGNTGALSFVYIDKGNITTNCYVWDMPTLVTVGKGKTKSGNTKKHTVIDESELKRMLSVPITHAFIEKAQSMPKQGAPATFNYAASYGIVRGICVGLGIPYTLVHPATWKKVIMKDMDRGKDAAIVRAKQLFPYAEIGKKDGRAEALLIAFYGIKELL